MLTFCKLLLLTISAAELLVAAKNERVCSATQCLQGRTASHVFAQSSAISLLPGNYTSSSQLDFTESLESIATSLSVQADSYVSASFDASRESLTIRPPDTNIMFSSYAYSGQRVPLGQYWQSLYIPPGSYANVGEGKVLWNPVADSEQLPSSISGRKIITFGSTGCEPACSSHGTCLTATSNATTKGICQCSAGWTGHRCEICAKGYYGPNCQPCASDCTVCDDGQSGTGQCLGTRTSPLKDCKCSHGTCSTSDPTRCTCAAGWKTDSRDSLQCSQCIEGYALNSQGDCRVCPVGCTACGSASGFANKTTCSKCMDGWTLSPSTGLCISNQTACQAGQYYDRTTSSCSSCSPACATCTGGDSTDCLTCTSPRINFMGSCVGFSFADGVCDTALSGSQGMFVADNAPQACNSCPAGCLTCAIPNFSPGSSLADAKCGSCQQGFLLEDGACVQRCSAGRFAPAGASINNGTCQTCDSNVCSECVSSSTTCTRCASADMFATPDGHCSQLCPTGYFPVNSTCQACNADCATCSGGLSCDTCPLGRPVLLNGQCVPSCPSNQYYDSTSSTCSNCDAGCLTCVGAGAQQCTSCPGGEILHAGQCTQAACDAAGFAFGFGICLSSFLSKPVKRWWLYLLLALALVGAIGFAAWWYIRKQRQKQRTRVQEFGDALDDVSVSRRLQVLRLERVLGLQRAPAPDSVDPATPTGLKTLRLPLFAQWRRNDEKFKSKRRSDFALTDPPPPPYDTSGAAHSRTALVDKAKSESFMMEEPGVPGPVIFPASSSSRDTKDVLHRGHNPFRAI